MNLVKELRTLKTGMQLKEYGKKMSSPIQVRSAKAGALILLSLSTVKKIESNLKKAAYKFFEKLSKGVKGWSMTEPITGIKIVRVETKRYEYLDPRIEIAEAKIKELQTTVKNMKKDSIIDGDVTELESTVYFKATY